MVFYRKSTQVYLKDGTVQQLFENALRQSDIVMLEYSRSAETDFGK